MIILKTKSGEIAVMNVVDGADKTDAITKFMAQHPEFIDYYEGDYVLPVDRKFRDAWEIKNNKIVVNDKKAMDIHLSRIRERRNEKLELLDKEQVRYLTDNWKVQEIETKKQLLRDLPAGITTLDWPDGL